MSPGEKLDPLPDTFILQPPVFHPVIPYVTTIFGGLRAGKMVMLQGAVPLNARRFMVDFQCGCSLHPRPDIAIHFNPRFHTTKPHVICNTLYRGRWQAEARWPHVALQRGASFLILFLFGNEEMKVSVNGHHFLHYRYRLPLSRVDTLGIFGDILVTAVGFLNANPFVEGGSEYPVGHQDLPFSGLLHIAQGPAAPSLTVRTPWLQLALPQPMGAWICLSLVPRPAREDGCGGLTSWSGQGPAFLPDPSQMELQQPCKVAGWPAGQKGNETQGLGQGHTPFLLRSPGLEVPCSHALPQGLWPGQVIIVRGLVLPEPKDPFSGPFPQFHAQSARRGRPRSRDTQGILCRQNSGLGLPLGPEEADLGPLSLLPPAILRGAAPVPGGRPEAGTQRAGRGGHQPGPAGPGAATGTADQW
ncbi:galectin-12 isoform 2-T2 [Dama dama]|uniref:galectin-12 isoform X2 n=1 Tax=Dama dama TaxID=30532 RepID=UPI002A369952|nr:galectin-12 isoform X2 [Dama dama]